jgi:hypothetical protein
MSQSASSRSRTQTHSGNCLDGNTHITRSMLLQACSDVEHELQRSLRRQRWLSLGKQLRRSFGL